MRSSAWLVGVFLDRFGRLGIIFKRLRVFLFALYQLCRSILVTLSIELDLEKPFFGREEAGLIMPTALSRGSSRVTLSPSKYLYC